MGWEKWGLNGERALKTEMLRVPFYIFTLTLLSLLLPLSFLLLARLSTAQHLLTFTSYPSLSPACFLLSMFLYTELLHLLISLISITTLLHGLTGRITLINGSVGQVLRPRLYTTWVFLCTLQVCVGLGIEGTIAAGIWSFDYDVENERSITSLSRIIFFIGLHETMLHWSRMIVRPVADDTIFGVVGDERWVEKVAMGTSFGALWWWRLRYEVDGFLIATEVNRKYSFWGLGITDLVSWWLYYLTVTIGMVKLVRGLIWLGKVLLCKKVAESHGCSCGDDDKV